MAFYYTYVLECNDGTHYIGSASDVFARFKEHENGRVTTTSKRLPVTLIYFEACRSKEQAQKRERYFKTGFGRQFIKNRI